jgi:glycosyltransferase involved in cell wall biosynthesis
VSESVASEIRSHFPHAAGKLTAIPNGIDADFFRPKPAGTTRAAIHARLNLRGDYVLYLGALMARKNLETAIRGFSEYLRDPLLRASARSAKLVLAGMTRSKTYEAGLRTLAEKLAPGAVIFTGFITDEECLALLQHATVFLAPSRGEGFDLPALEAMACAIPVLCSDIPVHRELLGNSARFFPTNQPERLATELHRLMTHADLRAQMAQQGPARAACFTWENAMQRLGKLYHEILSGPRVAAIAS